MSLWEAVFQDMEGIGRRGGSFFSKYFEENEEYEDESGGSDFFFPNACQICGCTSSEKALLRCAKCQMISYCGKDHQTQHWPSHKHFCKAITEVRRKNDILKAAKDRKQETWMNAKLSLITLVTLKLLRKLTPHEEKVIKFPRACLVCHDVDQHKLINCPKCPSASFCQQHKNLREEIHDDKCPEFKICHTIDLEKLREKFEAKNNPRKKEEEKKKKSNSEKKSSESESKKEMEEYLDPGTVISVIKEMPMKNLPYFEKLPDSMKSFFDMFLSKNLKMSEVENLDIVDMFIKPLSVFRALEKLVRVEERELIIHVIGAQVEDLDSYLFWETLLHWMPNLISLKVVLVGEEFVRQNLSPKICEKCVEKDKKIDFELYNLGYKNFMKEESFSKPNLVIGFKIQVKKEMESLGCVANFDIPFAFTSDENKEAKEEHKSMKKILGKLVAYEAFEKNPFAGRKPTLCFETDGISYKHQFLTIYKDLGKTTKENNQQNGF